MLLRTRAFVTKPPQWARVDLTHPLGRKCQLACLFAEGAGTPKYIGPGGFSVNFTDGPHVDYYQTQGNRLINMGGTTTPSWTTNAAGRCLLFGATYSKLQWGTTASSNSFDLDYPEVLAGVAVTRGQTVCLIRRKVDTTLRPSTLFGVEDSGGGNPITVKCGSHCPYSDGTVYWDYGGNSAPNRLTISGLTFTTLVERWTFTAGPQGMAIWRDGKKLTSSSTAITRVVTDSFANFGSWNLNGGNGLPVATSGDAQEVNFAMYLATQWTDEQCRWWAAEPYAAFYVPFMGRSYYFLGTAAGTVPFFDLVSSVMPERQVTRVAY